MRAGFCRLTLIPLLLIFCARGRAANSPSAAPLVPGTPPLLARAFDAFLEGQQRWAYTESSTSFEPDGRSHHVSDIRVDPSQPYDQQFVPLQIIGRPPTEKEIKQWARGGEQLAKRRHAAAERLAGSAQEADFRLQLFDEEVTPDLSRATLTAEDETSATFTIPLHQAGGPDAPEYTVFELTARISKITDQFQQATFRQRATVRVGAGKKSDGLLEVEFGTPDTRFPAIPVKLSWRSINKPLFGPAHPSRSEKVRTNLRRVKPYDERFQVKLAPLKLLEL